jgi:hypothetical protein
LTWNIWNKGQFWGKKFGYFAFIFSFVKMVLGGKRMFNTFSSFLFFLDKCHWVALQEVGILLRISSLQLKEIPTTMTQQHPPHHGHECTMSLETFYNECYFIGKTLSIFFFQPKNIGNFCGIIFM